MFIDTTTSASLKTVTCESRTAGSAAKGLESGLAALDLGPIMFKLASEDDGAGWPAAKVKHVEFEYRKFLTLCAEMPGEQIVPSKDVDEMWHTHILDTAKYAEDCEAIFGYFLHHFPYLGLRGEEDAKALIDASNRTKELFLARFGQQVSPRDTATCCWGNTTCGDDIGGITSRPSFSDLEALSHATADCMVGCGSVVCDTSACTNNTKAQIRPTFTEVTASV